MLDTLYTTHEDDQPVDLDAPIGDPLIVRHLLIELQINQRRAEKLKATLASVEGEYQARIAMLAEREAAIRQSLHNYVSENGKVSFPDVGGCSITKRQPTARVVDGDAALAWARENLPDAVATSLRITEVIGYVKETGELPPGVEMVESPDSLTIRKAAG